ncbi:hypothetical protein YC2023_007885 [Brassica napus]
MTRGREEQAIIGNTHNVLHFISKSARNILGLSRLVVYVRTHLKSLNMSMESVRTLVRAEVKTYTVYVVAPLVSRNGKAGEIPSQINLHHPWQSSHLLVHLGAGLSTYYLGTIIVRTKARCWASSLRGTWQHSIGNQNRVEESRTFSGDSLSGDFKDESTSPIDLLPHRRFSADSNPNEVCVPPSSDLDDFVVINNLYLLFLGSVMAKAPPEISRTNRHPQSICCLIDAIDLLPHRRFSTDSNLNEVCVPPSSWDCRL